MNNFKIFKVAIYILLLFILLSSNSYPEDVRKSSPQKSSEANVSKIEETKKPETPKTPEKKPIFEYREPEAPKFASPILSFLKAVFSLIFIIFLIYITIFVLKHFLFKKTIISQSGLINIWESAHLSQNKSIHIVEIAGEVFIIGASESGINLLKEVTDYDAIKLIKTTHRPRQKVSTQPFKKYLDMFSDKFKISGETSKELGPNTRIDLIKDEIEKFRRMRKKEN